MSAHDSAKACGTNRATYALRRQLVAAEVRPCETPGIIEQDLVKQLQVDRWPACHSLFLNLEQLPEGFQATADALNKIRLAASGNNMPLLHCLHIIGRTRVPLTENGIEGFLVDVLARHASVMTLQVKTLKMPLTMPNLQHLVLFLDKRHVYVYSNDEELFPAISMLKGLKTLYIFFLGAFLGLSSLANCVHLQRFAAQGDVTFVRSTSSTKRFLPAGCQLHALLSDGQVHGVEPWITGVTLRHHSILAVERWSHGLLAYETNCCRSRSPHPDSLRNLRRMRLFLDYERPLDKEVLECYFGKNNMPALEVLELEVHGNLNLWIDVELKSLVVIVAGTLYLKSPGLCGPSPMYLQAKNDFWPRYKKVRQASLSKEQCSVPLDELPRYVKDKQGHWSARRPTDFRPANLRDCCCKACLECLARDGVPILCKQGWTTEGLRRHLRA